MQRDNPYYNARVKYYPNGTQKITVFNRGVFNPDGWERIRKEDEEEKDRREYDLTNPREDNVKRAKDKIFDIAFMNEWDYMVTLTLDQAKIDRYDAKEINKRVGKWLKNQVQRKDLRYLVIPEYHKDGAVHFHGFFKGNMTYLNTGKRINPAGKFSTLKIGVLASRMLCGSMITGLRLLGISRSTSQNAQLRSWVNFTTPGVVLQERFPATTRMWTMTQSREPNMKSRKRECG